MFVIALVLQVEKHKGSLVVGKMQSESHIMMSLLFFAEPHKSVPYIEMCKPRDLLACK